MKSTFLVSFLLIALIGCSNESQSTKNEIAQVTHSSETIETVAQPITTDYIGRESNFDSTTISQTEPLVIEEKAEIAEKVEVIEEVEITEELPTVETTIPEVIEETVIEKVVESVPQVKAEIHKTWDDLLKKYVSSSGKVNYAGFKTEKAELDKYIKELQSIYSKVDSWNKNKRLAYWINVYNAVTVKLITDNYPLKSIQDLNGGKPWDLKLINLGGTSYTLNVIENKIIRPKYNEPRIHFAVNCAAKSCPKIMNKAWTEDNIQRYLTKQTKAFLANTSQNKIAADKVVLSKIFDWYKVDFGGDNTKLIEFINKYSDVKVNDNATVTFNEYNWELNN